LSRKNGVTGKSEGEKMKPFRYLYNLPDLGGAGVKKWGQSYQAGN
jgi:hypothetical protein